MMASRGVPVSALKRFITTAVICLVLASTGYGQESAASHEIARGVKLKIEATQSVYHAGDSIALRLTLHNLSGRQIIYTATTATGLAQLRVLDSEDRPIKRNVSGRASFTKGDDATLAPQEQKVLEGIDGKEWISLRDWGYDLRVPGTYTIVGFPMIIGRGVPLDTTVRSNRLRVKIKG
jgi:hypothetical protein